jgi:two-component sensor histidine kinase
VSTQHREAAAATFVGQHDPARGVALRAAEPQQIEFGDYLSELCDGLAADELITNAFEHAFPDGRTGRIDVRFAADPGAWRLTVRDSGVGLGGRPGGGSNRRGAGLEIARMLVAELGGRPEFPGVIGGTRCVAVAPRRPAASAQ